MTIVLEVTFFHSSSDSVQISSIAASVENPAEIAPEALIAGRWLWPSASACREFAQGAAGKFGERRFECFGNVVHVAEMEQAKSNGTGKKEAEAAGQKEDQDHSQAHPAKQQDQNSTAS